MATPVLTLAGALTLSVGGRRIEDRDFAGPQQRLVTAILLHDRARPRSAEHLADEVWGDDVPAQWRPALRNLVSRTRRLLGDAGLDADTVIVNQGGRYLVQLPDLHVDLEAARACLAEAGTALQVGDASLADELAGRARSVLSRPVLAGIEAPWLDQLRGHVARDHLEALMLLGDVRRATGHVVGARAVLHEALELAPLREDAWRALMQVEVDAGNAATALQLYEECRSHLAGALGVDPSPETQALHVEILRAEPEPVPAATVSRPTTSMPPRAPYVGLRAFDRGDADRFFGRDAVVQQLVGLVAANGAVAVVGPSGIGKSSLVRAGLLPALAHGAIPDSDTWPAIVVTPGERPLAALASALDDLAPGAVEDPESLVDRLVARPEALRDVVADVLAGTGRASARLVVVVDQAEELFTSSDEHQAGALLDAMVGSLRRADPEVAFVATLRADLYDRAAADPRMAHLLTTAQLVVPPMAPDELESAVVGPLRLVGGRLGHGVLGRILVDALDQPGRLPLLQFALLRMWEDREDDTIDMGVHDRAGGVTAALVSAADGVLADMPEHVVDAVRRLLLHLVDVDGERVTRRRVPVSALAALEGVDEDLVERLAASRLLTLDRDPVRGEPTAELSHEAVAEAWPRLRGWIHLVRGQLVEAQRVRADALAWEHAGRDPDLLYRGRPLSSARELAVDGTVPLDDRERAFIAAGARAEERTVRSRRRARTAGAVLAALLLATSVVAFVNQRQSQQQRAAAERAELLSTASGAVGARSDLALLLAVEAFERRAGAEEQRVLLDAVRQYEGVASVWAGATTDVGTTDGFCVGESERGVVLVQPNSAPFAPSGGSPGRVMEVDLVANEVVRDIETPLWCTVRRSPPGTSPVRYAGMPPERDRVVVVDDAGAVQLEVEGLVDPVFLPDGRLLARPAGVAPVEWEVVDPLAGERQPSGLVASNVESVPGGDLLWVSGAEPFLTGQDGPGAGWPQVRIVDGHTFDTLATFEEGRPMTTVVAAAASRVAVGTFDDTTVVVDLEDGSTQELDVGPLALSFSPSGDRLAVAGQAGRLQVHDLEAGVVVLDRTVGSSLPVAVHLDRDGDLWSMEASSLVTHVQDGAPGLGHRSAVRCCRGEVFAIVVPDAEPNPVVLRAGEGEDGLHTASFDAVTGEPGPLVDMHSLVVEQGLTFEARFEPDGHALMVGNPFRVARLGLDGTVGATTEPFGGDVDPGEFGRTPPMAERRIDGRKHLFVVLPTVGDVDLAQRVRLGTIDGEASLVDGPHDVDLAHDGSITALAGGWLLVDRAGQPGTSDVYDHAGQLVHTLELSATWGWAHLTRDGRYLLHVDARDDAVHWQDLDTGATQTLPVRGSPGAPLALADHRVVVETQDGQFQLWDLSGPTWLGTLADAGASVDSAYPTAHPDGSEVWLALDGWYRRVPLDPQAWVRRACELAARSLTQEEWADLVPGDAPYRDACVQGGPA